jgi:aryl-alcohol dehydrogenase-like predicted oxidoreductase
MATDSDTRALGRTGIRVLPLGIGTNKWRRADPAAVRETHRTVMAAGPCMIDTAEIYRSERIVGDCLRADPGPAIIATKFAPFPGRTSPRRLMRGLDASLARLGLSAIDLYYVHFPLPWVDVRVFADGLAEAIKSGKARAVGVANFSADQMRRIADLLAKAGVPLAANQVSYSLLQRKPETNGVLDACRELDVALVAYFPLVSGRLTHQSDRDRASKLLALLAEIAGTHDASISQVALNWLLARDPHVIPIPGATKPHHARANLASLGWRLSEAEFDAIDRASVPRR